MDGVVLPLSPTTNHIYPGVLLPLNDNGVWEGRWYPLSEERALFTSVRESSRWRRETKKVRGQQTRSCDSAHVLWWGNPRLNRPNPCYSGLRRLTNDLAGFAPLEEADEPGIADREASSAKAVCETSELMVCVLRYRNYRLGRDGRKGRRAGYLPVRADRAARAR